MKTLADALKCVEIFQNQYRHPQLDSFVVSGLYDLFPDKETTHSVSAQWPDEWLNNGKAGVYLFLDEELNVVYIGKADSLGRRLYDYCRSNQNSKCILQHTTWKVTPRFLVTVGMAKETWFENSSLESYLIRNVPTSDNVVGNY